MTEPKLRVLLMYRGTFLIQYLQVTPSCRGHKAHYHAVASVTRATASPYGCTLSRTQLGSLGIGTSHSASTFPGSIVKNARIIEGPRERHR